MSITVELYNGNKVLIEKGALVVIRAGYWKKDLSGPYPCVGFENNYPILEIDENDFVTVSVDTIENVLNSQKKQDFAELPDGSSILLSKEAALKIQALAEENESLKRQINTLQQEEFYQTVKTAADGVTDAAANLSGLIVGKDAPIIEDIKK